MRNGAGVRPFEQRKKTLQHSRWSRGTAGDVKVDRDHFGNTSNDRVAAGEAAAIPRTISDRDDPFWIGGCMIGALQRFAPVLGYGPGHEPPIGMATPNPKWVVAIRDCARADRKSTRLNSSHT